MLNRVFVAVFAIVSAPSLALTDDPVFSGPQPGETIAPLTVRGVFDDRTGQDLHVVGEDESKPSVLIFVHARTRPGFALTNAVMRYAATRTRDGLKSHVIFLTDDATATQTWLTTVRRHLPEGPSYGISRDGLEGPGAYGLNRNVTLTVLVCTGRKVANNFALVQPSVQADGPKILKAIVDVTGGGDVPDITDFDQRRGTDQANQDPKLRALLRPLIQSDATPEQVEQAAKAIEEYASKTPPARQEIGRICRTIIKAGKLSNYGTAPAQEHLKKWAREFAVQQPSSGNELPDSK